MKLNKLNKDKVTIEDSQKGIQEIADDELSGAVGSAPHCHYHYPHTEVGEVISAE